MLNYYKNIENIFNLKVNIMILAVVLVKIFVATYFYSPLPENNYIPYLQEIVNSFSVFVDKSFLNKNPSFISLWNYDGYCFFTHYLPCQT